LYKPSDEPKASASGLWCVVITTLGLFEAFRIGCISFILFKAAANI
jgi:hypothetical protein